MIIAGVIAPVLLAGALIGASQLDAREEKPAVAPATTLLRGIPQQGTALGSPSAPVTLIEYADLQCPYCGEWARNVFPQLVREYVSSGKLRIVYRGLAFIGPDSYTALQTAVAAGQQDNCGTSSTSFSSDKGTRTWGGRTRICFETSFVPQAFPACRSRRP
jgi:protein-disulfide isomerase